MDNMDFKLNRETFTGTQMVLDTSFEQSVEHNFVLPDYFPDIFRILKCFVMPCIVSQSINGNKLTYETSVTIKVLYLSENDNRINCLEQKLNFTKTADLTGACTNPFVTIVPRCDYVNCRVVNQRRLDIRGAVTSTVKVQGEFLTPVVVDAFGGNIQLKKQLVTYPAKRLTASKRVTVIDELELAVSKPSVGAVIRSDCVVVPQEQKMIAGKLITKGNAEISMLYTCVTADGEDSVESMKFTLPFSQIIDVEGIDESFEADVDISAGSCEIISKGEDSKSLECELVLLVNCEAVKYETCQVVTDAYSTCYECEVKVSESRMRTVPVKVDEMQTVSGNAVCTDEPVGCVYDCWADKENVSSRFDEEKNCFVVTGNIKFCVLGRSESKVPFLAESESPFEQEIKLPENCEGAFNGEYEHSVKVMNCSYYLADENNIELKAEVNIGGTIIQQCARSMINEIEIKTDKPKQKKDNYALKLCYCSSNDDIWEIAKKYSTSITAIMEENDLQDDKVTEKGMLLIPLMK